MQARDCRFNTSAAAVTQEYAGPIRISKLTPFNQKRRGAAGGGFCLVAMLRT